MSRGKGKGRIGNPSTRPPGETHRKRQGKGPYGAGGADRIDDHASNPRTVKKRREGERKSEQDRKAG